MRSRPRLCQTAWFASLNAYLVVRFLLLLFFLVYPPSTPLLRSPSIAYPAHTLQDYAVRGTPYQKNIRRRALREADLEEKARKHGARSSA